MLGATSDMTVFLATRAREQSAAFSPDGNSIAYASDESWPTASEKLVLVINAFDEIRRKFRSTN
jgi:Tol biopolymer transport system component